MSVDRVALIGAGSIAWSAYLEDLARRRSVNLTAVVARSQDTRSHVSTNYHIPHQFGSVAELIEFGDFDQAFVLTPPEFHHQQVVALLGAGHDVLCEKPVALELGEVRNIEQVQRDTGRAVVIAFNRRYCPAYLKAKEAFAERKVDVCLVQKNKDSNQKRALLHDAIHAVDTLRWFCGGEVQEVQARAVAEDIEAESSLTASVLFSTGALGVFIMNRTSGGWQERLEARGSGQTVTVDYPETATITTGGHATTWSATPANWGGPSAATRLGFSKLIDHFFSCVRGEVSCDSVGEARKTHELVDKIYRAAGLPPHDV